MMRIFYLLLLICPLVAPAVTKQKVDHDYVVELARTLVKKPYDADRGRVAKAFRTLDYDSYRRILFRREKSLWSEDNLPFRAQFFHPGFIHNYKVELNEFTEGYAQRIPFNREWFEYHQVRFPFWAYWNTDYAGFRLLHQLNETGKWDEVISFLGASYFRALARGQVYGISARGIAINTGEDEPEEFPRFSRFWLGKPARDAEVMVVHGLLEGPSITGAYTFIVRPGDDTMVDVKATLFMRKEVKSLGLAPLTSMFWFGEASPHRFGDFRPEVHDSDGLLVAMDENTRIWRPLDNPSTKRLAHFPVGAFHGFGLLQRDREFHSYEDLEARYEARPGLWVEPMGQWPKGEIRLMELPTNTEHHDNVVAWWIPVETPRPGTAPLELSWRLHWSNAGTFGGPAGWVKSVRRTIQDGAPGRTQFVIDYAFADAVDPTQPPEADITAPHGVEIASHQVIYNPTTQSWRLDLRLAAQPDMKSPGVRVRLVRNGAAVTETLDLPWQP